MKLRMTLAVLALLTIAGGAQARDTHLMLPIKDAIEAPAAKAKLDSGIQLIFAGQPHGKVTEKIGEWSTSKKTNSFGKSAAEACNWAFLSAMLTLQERARKEGGNAVIDIKSTYRNVETESATDFMCGDGAFATGVAFKGTVVKLAD